MITQITHVVTANGNTINAVDVTHQHWSNIYWYNRIFSHTQKIRTGHRNRYMDGAMEFAEKLLGKKYDGVILDWKPVYRQETEMLLSFSESPEYELKIDVCDIIFQGRKIGKILDGPLLDMEHPKK